MMGSTGMFVTDKLVFIELHKTGGTHICTMLNRLVGGQQQGKHNRLDERYKGRFILGSVRNPWDWYVSLWAYGCGGEGSVRIQTTRRYDLSYYRRQLPKEMGIKMLGLSRLSRQISSDISKPVSRWQWCYEDYEDPDRFRAWLHLLLDSDRYHDIGEGFGFSPISNQFGLLTYRYFKLFTDIGQELYSSRRLATLGGLGSAWDRYSYMDYIIRNEKLEEDFSSALEAAGIDLTPAQQEQLTEGQGKKINTSRRNETSFYYDSETSKLVADRERFIIERHQYQEPELT